MDMDFGTSVGAFSDAEQDTLSWKLIGHCCQGFFFFKNNSFDISCMYTNDIRPKQAQPRRLSQTDKDFFNKTPKNYIFLAKNGNFWPPLTVQTPRNNFLGAICMSTNGIRSNLTKIRPFSQTDKEFQ